MELTHAEKIKQGKQKANEIRQKVDELNVLLKMFGSKSIAFYEPPSSRFPSYISPDECRYRKANPFRLTLETGFNIEYFPNFDFLKRAVETKIANINA